MSSKCTQLGCRRCLFGRCRHLARRHDRQKHRLFQLFFQPGSFHGQSISYYIYYYYSQSVHSSFCCFCFCVFVLWRAHVLHTSIISIFLSTGGRCRANHPNRGELVVLYGSPSQAQKKTQKGSEWQRAAVSSSSINNSSGWKKRILHQRKGLSVISRDNGTNNAFQQNNTTPNHQYQTTANYLSPVQVREIRGGGGMYPPKASSLVIFDGGGCRGKRGVVLKSYNPSSHGSSESVTTRRYIEQYVRTICDCYYCFWWLQSNPLVSKK